MPTPQGTDTFFTFFFDNPQPGTDFLLPSLGTANVGTGPLYLRAVLPANPDSTVVIMQRIFRDDGTWWERDAGTYIFDPNFHSQGGVIIDNWGLFRIREVLSGTGIGPTLVEGSTGELVFIYDVYPFNLAIDGAPSEQVFESGQCDSTWWGLSSGWLDINFIYPVELSGIPNGVYWLEGEFDPENKFLESNESNNISRKLITLCHNNFFVPQSDSMWISDVNGPAGSQVRVDVGVWNNLNLGRIKVPFSWAGDLNLTLDSVSNAGTRTESEASLTLVAIDPFSKFATYVISYPNGAAPGLSPGIGAVLSLYFSIGEGAEVNAMSAVSLVSIGGNDPRFSAACGNFIPPSVVSGSVTNLCCNKPGDANNDGSFNISDVTFNIARIFADGSAPECSDKADANGDNSVNIADITFAIARIFSGGPAPICGTTGA